MTEKEIKLTKIVYEYSNGSRVEVNAEDLDLLNKAIVRLLDFMKEREDALKKS